MITLKIKEAGHTIDIPGLKVCRSPVNLDISNLDIRVISMFLKTSGIEKYEIIAEAKSGEKEIYTKSDFEVVEKRKVLPVNKDIETRFNRLEKMMETLLLKQTSKLTLEKEQITNKLDKLERLLHVSKQRDIQSSDKPSTKKGKLNKDPEIEELNSFIPDVDIKDMKIKSDIKTIKQEDDNVGNTVDLLFDLIRK